MKRILRMDWDIIAGIAAAIIAVILHLLHVADVDVLLTIVLVLLALLLLRDLRREGQDEEFAEELTQVKSIVETILSDLQPSDAVLIGPRHLRQESQRFAESASGQMVWFNVCFLMFQSQDVFDLLLRPAIENEHVESIQFVSNASERSLWEEYLVPKINQCPGSQKVRDPRWCHLPQTISFILADTTPNGSTEALLSFWGEPFMSHTTNQQVPRYIFRVHGHSELVSHFVELERHHRMS